MSARATMTDVAGRERKAVEARDTPRIAFVNQCWNYAVPPHPAGSIEIWTYEVARRITERAQPVIYAGTRVRPYSLRHEDVDYRFIPTAPDAMLGRVTGRLPAPDPRRPRIASRWHYPLYAVQVAARLRGMRPDVVRVQNQLSFVPAIRALNPHVRIVLHMHSEWLSQLDPRVVAPALARVDAVIGCSEHVIERVRRAFPQYAGRCHTVPNGVAPERFRPVDRAGAAAPREAGPRLLFVGRISPEKGTHLLIDGFVTLARRFPGATLDLVGPLAVLPRESLVALSDEPWVQGVAACYDEAAGDYGAQLQRRIPADLADRVRFRGACTHEEIVRHYQEADILVNPSVSEAFGMSLVEAMASGVPVVATRVGGAPEIVVPDETGLLVEPGDAGALATALGEIAAQPTRWASMGAAGRERVLERFSWEHVADRLLDCYRTFDV